MNLENAHLRTDEDTFTSDHVLDVEIGATGEIGLKDEDELIAAVEQGRLSVDEARQIERHAEAAIAAFHAGSWVFDHEWVSWRPDSNWSIPTLES